MPPQNQHTDGVNKEEPKNIPEKKEIDLDKILLPKKEAPGKTVDSAQRINAAALLAQEQGAELPKPQPKPQAPPTTPKEPEEELLVKPLQTFQGDIEKVVKEKNVSVVTMAAAEAERRAQAPIAPAQESKPVSSQVQMWSMIGGGVVLIALAITLIVFLFLPPAALPPKPEPHAPFVAVDSVSAVGVEPAYLTRESVMSTLVATRDTFTLSLGLLAQLKVGIATTSSELDEFDTQEFLSLVAPRTPEELVRTLNDEFLLGIHSYDGNQPFLILESDSYERAYAGMLAWERSMQSELWPLFNRKPPIRNTLEPTSTTTAPAPLILRSDFVDRIIENHDARVVQNEYRDILLLWTFLDRRTILIATNDATVREVVRRLKDASTIVLP